MTELGAAVDVFLMVLQLAVALAGFAVGIASLSAPGLLRFRPNLPDGKARRLDFSKWRRDGSPDWTMPTTTPRLSYFLLFVWMTVFVFNFALSRFTTPSLGSALLMASAVFNVVVVIIQFGHTDPDSLADPRSETGSTR